MSKPIVALSRISKRFGPVVANDAVDLEIQAGEVLALLGENGAGKSTLMKVLYGFHQPDAGEIRIDDMARRIASPREAIALGIGMVFQQFTLVPALSVIENLLAAWPRAPWWQGRGRPRVTQVIDRLRRLSPDLDPARPVRALAVGERQLVELAKVLNLDSRVIILDEPSSVLTPTETERLYGLVRLLADEGRAVVLITHKLADVAACADRTVVMRAGRIVDAAPAAARSKDQLVAAMVGHAPAPAADPPPPVGGTRLVVRGASAHGVAGRIEGIDLEVAAGEVLGIAGVSGNGQTMLAEAIAGLAPLAAGDVVLDGESIAGRRDENAIAGTIAYLPERPIDNAVVVELDAAINLALRGFARLPFFPRRVDLDERAHKQMAAFDIRPPRPSTRAGAFSGGNLQKLVIARELSSAPRLVIACYPTMGLDVAATGDVYRRLFAHAADGAAVVWISEELDDLMRYAHRIAVIHHGRIAGVVARDAATRQGLGRWMTGAQA